MISDESACHLLSSQSTHLTGPGQQMSTTARLSTMTQAAVSYLRSLFSSLGKLKTTAKSFSKACTNVSVNACLPGLATVASSQMRVGGTGFLHRLARKSTSGHCNQSDSARTSNLKAPFNNSNPARVCKINVVSRTNWLTS